MPASDLTAALCDGTAGSVPRTRLPQRRRLDMAGLTAARTFRALALWDIALDRARPPFPSNATPSTSRWGTYNTHGGPGAPASHTWRNASGRVGSAVRGCVRHAARSRWASANPRPRDPRSCRTPPCCRWCPVDGSRSVTRRRPRGAAPTQPHADVGHRLAANGVLPRVLRRHARDGTRRGSNVSLAIPPTSDPGHRVASRRLREQGIVASGSHR